MGVITFLTMFWVHIWDDFHNQGILADMKCRDWWNKNYPDELYKDDWAIALTWHSLQWAISIMLPILIYSFFSGAIYTTAFDTAFGVVVLTNTIIHFIVDNAKANKHKIGLYTDQIFHVIQISATFLIMQPFAR